MYPVRGPPVFRVTENACRFRSPPVLPPVSVSHDASLTPVQVQPEPELATSSTLDEPARSDRLNVGPPQA